METIKVFVTNLDTLKSVDIEFQYDSSILNITEFSLYGTALEDTTTTTVSDNFYDYVIADTSFIESGIFKKVKFTMYFENIFFYRKTYIFTGQFLPEI